MLTVDLDARVRENTPLDAKEEDDLGNAQHFDRELTI
jgi:hypothetical protein